MPPGVKNHHRPSLWPTAKYPLGSVCVVSAALTPTAKNEAVVAREVRKNLRRFMFHHGVSALGSCNAECQHGW